MHEWFLMGGIWMYAVLALAMALIPSGLVLLVLGSMLAPGARRAVGWVCVAGLVGGFLPLGAGAVGMVSGMSNVEAALRAVDPAYADEIREVGTREAWVPLWFGLGVAAVVWAEMGLALALAWRPADDAAG